MDRLRTELVGTGQLTIIERGKMEEVLEEQSFQQTGCVSSECAVEVGKLLGVEQIVTGNISKVGTLFSVTARVVSVQSGEIVRSTIYDHSGDIGGLLTQGMKKVAEELGK
jgi:TolB-like protein